MSPTGWRIGAAAQFVPRPDCPAQRAAACRPPSGRRAAVRRLCPRRRIAHPQRFLPHGCARRQTSKSLTFRPSCTFTGSRPRTASPDRIRIERLRVQRPGDCGALRRTHARARLQGAIRHGALRCGCRSGGSSGPRSVDSVTLRTARASVPCSLCSCVRVVRHGWARSLTRWLPPRVRISLGSLNRLRRCERDHVHERQRPRPPGRQAAGRHGRRAELDKELADVRQQLLQRQADRRPAAAAAVDGRLPLHCAPTRPTEQTTLLSLCLTFLTYAHALCVPAHPHRILQCIHRTRGSSRTTCAMRRARTSFSGSMLRRTRSCRSWGRRTFRRAGSASKGEGCRDRHDALHEASQRAATSLHTTHARRAACPRTGSGAEKGSPANVVLAALTISSLVPPYRSRNALRSSAGEIMRECHCRVADPSLGLEEQSY